MAVTLSYLVFLRVYDVGPRVVMVNGDNVERLDGLSIRFSTWLSRLQVERLLTRIHASGVSLPSTTKTYQGELYLRARDVVSVLQQAGDGSQFADGRLIVTLKANQHYGYSVNGNQVRQQAMWINGRLIGWTLAVYHDEATYMQTSQLTRLFKEVGLLSTWNGRSLELGLTGSVSPAPIQKPADYTAIAFGAGKTIYAPHYEWNAETYLPVYSLSTTLGQLGWMSTFGPWKWTLTSTTAPNHSQTPASASSLGGATRKPIVLAFVPYYFGNLAAFEDVMQHHVAYNALAADIWTVDPTGLLNGSAPAGAAAQAAAKGDAIYAMVANVGSHGVNSQEMTAILTSPSRRNRLQDAIVSVVESEGYDGATLDLESIPAADRTLYSGFVRNLAATLHTLGKQLDVVVPPDTGSDNEPWNGAYDQAKLGAVADTVIVMAYDYSYAGGPAGPIAPIPWVQETMAYTVSRVPANKVLLGIDTYGYDWSGNQTTAVGLQNVDSFLATHRIQPRWNAVAEAPWFTWTDNQGAAHTVYFENDRSTAAKLDLAQVYGTAGVAIWRAGLEDDAVLRVLSKYAKGTQN